MNLVETYPPQNANKEAVERMRAKLVCPLTMCPTAIPVGDTGDEEVGGDREVISAPQTSDLL